MVSRRSRDSPMTRDLFEGNPNLARRSGSLADEARADAGQAVGQSTIPVELTVWAERQRLIRRRANMQPRSRAGIELDGAIKYLTHRLLRLENERRGA